MPLVWTPLHSIARWTAPPPAPRVVRAAIPGSGWLIATEVAGGWSTTFVPDTSAADPLEAGVPSGGFQAVKVDWGAAGAPQTDEPASGGEERHGQAPRQGAREHKRGQGKSVSKRGSST